MDLKTFFGANNRVVISHIAISKSICGNLNSLSQGIHVSNSRTAKATLARVLTVQVIPASNVQLEEPRHAYSVVPTGRGTSEGLGTSMLAGKRDGRIHEGSSVCITQRRFQVSFGYIIVHCEIFIPSHFTRSLVAYNLLVTFWVRMFEVIVCTVWRRSSCDHQCCSKHIN